VDHRRNIPGKSSHTKKKERMVIMEYSDTEKLLRECDAGSKMAVTSIDEVIKDVKDEEMKQLLCESKDHHSKLGNEIHALLNQHDTDEKDPNPMAKGMSWLKTNMKLVMNESDHTIADLITEGCNMGVKSLNKYLNQYVAADEKSKDICKRLINLEEDLTIQMRQFL
jgi:hypothetical protein